LHERDGFGREFQPDERRLRETDAVLATDRPAKRDDPFEQLPLGLSRSAEGVVVGWVDQYVDVDVTVTDVTKAWYRQVSACSKLVDQLEEISDLSHGHDDVVVDLARRQGPQGERQSPPFIPQAVSLCLRLSLSDVGRPVCPTRSRDARKFLLDRRRQPIDLNEK